MGPLDRGKVIVLGPKAQEVLWRWLDRDPESCCFVPAETLAWHHRWLRRRVPSRDRTGEGEARDRRLAPGRRSIRHSYRKAVRWVCRRAGIPVWSLRQLRHTRATLTRHVYGLEADETVLGHADTKITDI